jgi:hypothetical protein
MPPTEIRKPFPHELEKCQGTGGWQGRPASPSSKEEPKPRQGYIACAVLLRVPETGGFILRSLSADALAEADLEFQLLALTLRHCWLFTW